MIVTSLKHAALVKQRFEHRWKAQKKRLCPAYFAFDTETEALPSYPKDHTLIPQRAQIKIFSICFRGESYSFPTSHFSSQYPTEEAWGEFFAEWFQERSIIKVMHNANYDVNIAYYGLENTVISPIWDTMIGAWKAAEYIEKGLKARAVMYGRFLRETKTVNFANLFETAEYAEQDVVQTDEMFQMQMFGAVERPQTIVWVDDAGKFVQEENPLYQDRLVVPNESLSTFDKAWMKLTELPVLRATMRAERRGFPIDVYQFKAIRAKVNRACYGALKKLYRMAGWVFNPGSNKDLVQVFNELHIENPFRTQKGSMQFDNKALNKLSESHPFVNLLVKYKELVKLVSTYVGTKDGAITDGQGGLNDFINPRTGAIHSIIGTIAAVTGRSSSALPNLQNIPARKDVFGIRSCFVPQAVSPRILSLRYTRKLLMAVLDYGQLEIRVMALQSQDAALLKVLSDPKGDIHQYTADQFGFSRQTGKSANFAMLYGAGPYAVAEYLTVNGIPTDEHQAASYLRRNHEVYSGVVNFRKELLMEHQKNGYVRLITGRRRTLPDIVWSNEKSVHKAETTLSNNVTQGSGQDFLKASIVRSDWRCINPDREFLKRVRCKYDHKLYLKDKARELDTLRKTLKLAECNFRLQVHDEAIYTMLPSAAEECLKILAEIMSWRHYFPLTKPYSVPLVAEGGVGENWKEAKSDKALYHVSTGFKDWEKYK